MTTLLALLFVAQAETAPTPPDTSWQAAGTYSLNASSSVSPGRLTLSRNATFELSTPSGLESGLFRMGSASLELVVTYFRPDMGDEQSNPDGLRQVSQTAFFRAGTLYLEAFMRVGDRDRTEPDPLVGTWRHRRVERRPDANGVMQDAKIIERILVLTPQGRYYEDVLVTVAPEGWRNDDAFRDDEENRPQVPAASTRAWVERTQNHGRWEANSSVDLLYLRDQYGNRSEHAFALRGDMLGFDGVSRQ